jgi:predicted site-specific integrase-resolvase
MKLKEYAKKLGISYQTAWNHFKDNRIEGAYKNKFGVIMVPDEIFLVTGRGVVIYIRSVNSNTVPEKLQRITDWCNKRKYKIVETIIEYGDPWNNNGKIESLFTRNDWEIIVVEDFSDIFPVGHELIKILTRNRIEAINKINVNHIPTAGQDMMNLIKHICLHSDMDEEIANIKTEKIVKFILNELKSGN